MWILQISLDRGLPSLIPAFIPVQFCCQRLRVISRGIPICIFTLCRCLFFPGRGGTWTTLRLISRFKSKTNTLKGTLEFKYQDFLTEMLVYVIADWCANRFGRSFFKDRMADFNLLNELKLFNQTGYVAVLRAMCRGWGWWILKAASSASEMTLCAESMAPKHTSESH